MGTKEAKVKFKADTSELNQEITRSESKMKTFRSELKLNETQLKGAGDSTDLLQKRLSVLSDEMQEAKNKTALVEEKLAKAKETFGDNSEEVNVLTRELNSCKNVEASIQNDIAKTTKSLEAHEDAWEDSADAAEDAADTAEQAGNDLSGTFEKIGAAITTYLAVDKIKDVGVECIEAAADAQAAEAQFSQVFGDLEGKASESLSGIAETAGITENRMKGSYTKIAAFAKTTGMDTESALGLADRAMVAVADSAAFYDRSLEETTESLQSFLKGNYENDSALGLSCTEITRNEAANKLYGKSFQDLSESQKQLTLLQMVEDANAASGALGQAARESDTWTNQTGNLQQAWEDLQAILGNQILPAAVDGVTWLADAVQSVTDKIPAAVDWFNEYQGIITIIATVIGILAGAITLYNTVQGIKAAMNAAETTSLGGLIAAKWADAAATMAALAPYILIVAAIAAVIAIIVLLVKNWDTVKETAMNLWKSLVEVWENIKQSISDAVDGIKEWVSNGFETVKNTVGSIMTAASSTISSIWTGIKTTISNAVDSVKTKVSNTFDAIKTAIFTPLNAAKDKVSDIFNSIKSGISDKINGAKDSVKNAIDKIKGFFNFSWSLPELKMPHINITGKFSINPPSVPKFAIRWYKEGGILTAPTLFGQSGNTLLGGGEAGMEAVLPIEKLQGFFDNAIERAVNLQIATDVLAEVVHLLQVIANKDSALYVNGKRMSEELAGDSDEVNGTRIALRGRELAI